MLSAFFKVCKLNNSVRPLHNLQHSLGITIRSNDYDLFIRHDHLNLKYTLRGIWPYCPSCHAPYSHNFDQWYKGRKSPSLSSVHEWRDKVALDNGYLCRVKELYCVFKYSPGCKLGHSGLKFSS